MKNTPGMFALKSGLGRVDMQLGGRGADCGGEGIHGKTGVGDFANVLDERRSWASLAIVVVGRQLRSTAIRRSPLLGLRLRWSVVISYCR